MQTKAYLPQVQQILVDTILESLRSGTRGAQYDAWLYQQPWDFRLEDIEIDVHLWHGEVDKNVPVAMGRHVAKKIPHCRAKFIEDEGHISLIKKYRDEIITSLRV